MAHGALHDDSRTRKLHDVINWNWCMSGTMEEGLQLSWFSRFTNRHKKIRQRPCLHVTRNKELPASLLPSIYFTKSLTRLIKNKKPQQDQSNQKEEKKKPKRKEWGMGPRPTNLLTGTISWQSEVTNMTLFVKAANIRDREGIEPVSVEVMGAHRTFTPNHILWRCFGIFFVYIYMAYWSKILFWIV